MAPGTSEGEWETKATKLGAKVKVTGKYDDNPTGR
jgi:hypothetical protein